MLWTRLLSKIGFGVFDKMPAPGPLLPPCEWGEKDSPVLTAVSSLSFLCTRLCFIKFAWASPGFTEESVLTSALQILWAAVSDFPEGVNLMMECGCDALAAHAWFKSFDLLHQPPARRASQQDLSPTANSFKRRQAMVISASCRSALQALQVLVQCSQNGGNMVHPPIVAQLYSTEDFAAPQQTDVAWTRRVRGVSLQVASPPPPHCSAHHPSLFNSWDGLTGG
jgi:hypothetical protein